VAVHEELGAEATHGVDERHCELGRVAARRRFVEAVSEEEHPVGHDVHDCRVVGVVAADMTDLDADAVELETEAAREHDVRRGDANLARRRQLGLHIVRVCLRDLAGGNPAVERLVAPLEGGQLLEVARGQLVRDDVGVELRGAEDVVPVGVGEDDVARATDALVGEKCGELLGVRRGRPGVQPDRAPLPDHRAQ
jgi:hypothetical protein